MSQYEWGYHGEIEVLYLLPLKLMERDQKPQVKVLIHRSLLAPRNIWRRGFPAIEYERDGLAMMGCTPRGSRGSGG
ncbi:hypothetical protein Tco_1215430 [Tanacetum coccineum]